VTYGGLAHWACQARAVWPPLGGVQQFEYDPMIALRKMAMKEAFAGDGAQAHIQALMAIVGRDHNLPRPRQKRRDSLSSDCDRGLQQVASSPLQTSTAPLAPTTPRSVAHTTPSERKRTQHPTPTPKTTPSPSAKNARLNEPDPITQASEQQPTTSKKTSNQQPERKEGKPTAANEVTVTNQNNMREYALQTAVKAARGKFIVQDSRNVHGQYRCVVDGKEYQFTDNPECDVCDLVLEMWAYYPRKQTLCKRCGARSRRGKAEPTSICTWRCSQHDVEVCTSCIPVVLRTPVI